MVHWTRVLGIIFIIAVSVGLWDIAGSNISQLQKANRRFTGLDLILFETLGYKREDIVRIDNFNNLLQEKVKSIHRYVGHQVRQTLRAKSIKHVDWQTVMKTMKDYVVLSIEQGKFAQRRQWLRPELKHMAPYRGIYTESVVHWNEEVTAFIQTQVLDWARYIV
ncbi:uncharacterized protein KY384_004801 [Bacidia gigantensis]|uniref:uncharacterized protein n=1 Tax=Bacidia gigantensis TaxID=2732470 RepID=UPI001D047E48|nr:uncharacterized protein KY384_004801 [Bacidia gigantensis]KAG8530299.1 hypothetical protein KY384_004801 [Bacidia gigantensis]